MTCIQTVEVSYIVVLDPKVQVSQILAGGTLWAVGSAVMCVKLKLKSYVLVHYFRLVCAE